MTTSDAGATAAATDDRDGAEERRDREPTSGEQRYMEHSQLAGLARAAHPVPALVTALGVGLVAAIAGRALDGVLLAAAAALVAQLVLGLLDDVADRRVDGETGRDGKPIADGRLQRGNATFTIAVLFLLVVPLSMANGVVAGLCLLGYLLVGAISTLRLSGSVLSPLPWALSYALLAGFLAYGGVASGETGPGPAPLVVVLFALLGVGVHVMLALPDLVADNRAELRHLPLRLALKVGAPRLLLLTAVYLLLVLGSLALVLLGSGLTTSG